MAPYICRDAWHAQCAHALRFERGFRAGSGLPADKKSQWLAELLVLKSCSVLDLTTGDSKTGYKGPTSTREGRGIVRTL